MLLIIKRNCEFQLKTEMLCRLCSGSWKFNLFDNFLQQNNYTAVSFQQVCLIAKKKKINCV